MDFGFILLVLFILTSFASGVATGIWFGVLVDSRVRSRAKRRIELI